jgi:3-oxoadipate enol-lactonase
VSSLPHFSVLGSGHTVLMLHGVGGGHLAFAPQVETLASNGYRAVAWDMPGYGSSAPIEPYNFKGLAQSCIHLLECLQAGRATLLGHSMGGMVAQEVVARRPDLVERLVLAGTSPSFGRKADGTISPEWQKKFIAQRTAPLDAGQSMAQVAERLIPQMVGPAALPEGLQLAQRCMGAVAPSTYRRAITAMLDFDRRANLAHIHVPTLLIAGEFDRVAAPSVMREMSQAIAGSTYLEMKGVGHLQNLEDPEGFDGALLNFLTLPRQLH